MLKRAHEPFKGGWDFPGGYMNEKETPLETLARELEEELAIVPTEINKIGEFPGTASWKEKSFPIISHAFLVRGPEPIRLNPENSDYRWAPLADAIHDSVFDSNKEIASFIHAKFEIDLPQLKTLVAQLDPTATIEEHNYYQAVLNGHVSKAFVDGKLIGIGWIFPRRTLLRKQAVIEDVVVLQEYRGKGYGKQITLDLIRWAKEQGIEVVELTSGSHRVAANALYKKLGFTLHPTNHYLLQL